jgi:hypothetical protein
VVRLRDRPIGGVRVSTLIVVSTPSERRAAREGVAAYHEVRLGELIKRVEEALDRFREGKIDAFETDELIFQYSRAAKELWKFCNLTDVEFTASVIDADAPIDWWERGALRRRPA